jgi:hypothetical protein
MEEANEKGSPRYHNPDSGRTDFIFNITYIIGLFIGHDAVALFL